jgi:hypothetical protein
VPVIEVKTTEARRERALGYIFALETERGCDEHATHWQGSGGVTRPDRPQQLVVLGESFLRLVNTPRAIVHDRVAHVGQVHATVSSA